MNEFRSIIWQFVLLFSHSTGQKVWMLRFPSQCLDASYASALTKFFASVSAPDAIQIVAEKFAEEVIEALILIAKYIQFGEHNPENQEEIVNWYLYNQTGQRELVVANEHNKKLLELLPKVSVTWAAYRIISDKQIKDIIRAWRKADNVHFVFGLTMEQTPEYFIATFFRRCLGLTHSNTYELAHKDYLIELPKRVSAFMDLDENREIKITWNSCALKKSEFSHRSSPTSQFSQIICSSTFLDDATTENIHFGWVYDVRRFQFDALNSIKYFFKKFSGDFVYWKYYDRIEAISGRVDEINGPAKSDIPFLDLLKPSNMLKFILFRGIKRTKFQWPEGFYEVKNIQECYDASRLTWPGDGVEDAYCVGISANQGALYRKTYRCIEYEIIDRLDFPC